MCNLIAVALWQKGAIPTAEKRTGWPRTGTQDEPGASVTVTELLLQGSNVR